MEFSRIRRHWLSQAERIALSTANSQGITQPQTEAYSPVLPSIRIWRPSARLTKTLSFSLKNVSVHRSGGCPNPRTSRRRPTRSSSIVRFASNNSPNHTLPLLLAEIVHNVLSGPIHGVEQGRASSCDKPLIPVLPDPELRRGGRLSIPRVVHPGWPKRTRRQVSRMGSGWNRSSWSQRCWEPRVSKAPQKESRNLGAFVVQSAASDIDEPEVPLHSPHQ
jgi:hypothetical protein